MVSIGGLQRETFPDFTAHEIQIIAIYPGASTEEVEEVICQRIEDALDGVRFVYEVRSDIRNGLALVTVEMEEGGDFQTFKDEIETEINAINDFPEELEDPIITQLGTTDLALAILVSGPMEPPNLKALCEDFKDRLQRLPEISLVDVQGFSDHQFRIEFSKEALMRYHLSVTDVADIINRQNVDLPAGALETRDGDILVRFIEQRNSVQQLEDLIIIGGLGGAELRLGDIGRVTDTFEIDEDKILLKDRRTGLIRLEKTKNQDVVKVAESVKAFVQQERQRQPHVELRIIQDNSDLVVDRLNLLIKNGVQGMVFVFLALLLFFNAKLSFWVIMSLPVSFFGAFYVMLLLGQTINMMTMTISIAFSLMASTVLVL